MKRNPAASPTPADVTPNVTIPDADITRPALPEQPPALDFDDVVIGGVVAPRTPVVRPGARTQLTVTDKGRAALAEYEERQKALDREIPYRLSHEAGAPLEDVPPIGMVP